MPPRGVRSVPSRIRNLTRAVSNGPAKLPRPNDCIRDRSRPQSAESHRVYPSCVGMNPCRGLALLPPSGACGTRRKRASSVAPPWSTVSPKPWQRLLNPELQDPKTGCKQGWPTRGCSGELHQRPFAEGGRLARVFLRGSPRMILAGMRGVWGAEGGPPAPRALSGENAISPLRPPRRARAPKLVCNRGCTQTYFGATKI